jgi:hypothetical protein
MASAARVTITLTNSETINKVGFVSHDMVINGVREVIG